MSIEALVKKHCTNCFPESGLRDALTEQAEAYEQRIRELGATVAEYDRRIVAVGGVAINSVSREYHEAEVSRLNDLYEKAVAGRQAFRAKVRELEAQRVPEGWQLVPIEPTDQMIDAGCDEADAYRVDIDRAWRAMLAAAVTPKKEE